MDDGLNVFLLMGQSNMAGRGRPGEVSALRHPQVSMFRAGRWVAADEPLHTDKPEVAGAGLGMSFAVEVIARARLAPIGLVPCAVGGTPLSRWMPGADLYGRALALARQALSAGTLRGILWHQGEGDAGSAENARSYGRRFRQMIICLRDELQAGEVPVITGELGSFLDIRAGCAFYAIVNQQLRELADRLPACACAGAEGLTDNGDQLHFNAASLRELGKRYANRYLAIAAARKPRTEGALS